VASLHKCQRGRPNPIKKNDNPTTEKED